MEIRVWQSFSCNNSGGFRLVARFNDPSIASDAAQELTTFFKVHAKQHDKSFEDSDFEDMPPPTQACHELAKKYGFTWKDYLGWGDDGLVGDEPEVVALDKTLVIYHSYCGGFSKELPKYLEARGATKKRAWEEDGSPSVSVLFKLPNESKKLQTALNKLFAQATPPPPPKPKVVGDETAQDDNPFEYLSDWKIKPPWTGGDQDGSIDEVGYFNDGKTIGFHLPIQPKHLAKLTKYLEKNNVKGASLLLCEESDAKKFRMIASARCDSCDAPLTYVDPRTHQIEAEQLACDKCGGMYDLATIAKKKPKKAKPAKVVAAAVAVKKKTTTTTTTKKAAPKKKAKAAAPKKKKKAAAKKK